MYGLSSVSSSGRSSYVVIEEMNSSRDTRKV
jgi:hypothetical protein